MILHLELYDMYPMEVRSELKRYKVALYTSNSNHNRVKQLKMVIRKDRDEAIKIAMKWDREERLKGNLLNYGTVEVNFRRQYHNAQIYLFKDKFGSEKIVFVNHQYSRIQVYLKKSFTEDLIFDGEAHEVFDWTKLHNIELKVVYKVINFNDLWDNNSNPNLICNPDKPTLL